MFKKSFVLMALVLTLALSLVFAGFGRRAFAEEASSTEGAVTSEAAGDDDPAAVTDDPEGKTEDGAGDPEAPADAAGETEEAPEESEKPKVEFVLWKKLKKVDTKGWIMFAAAAAIAAGMIVLLATRKKTSALESADASKASTTLILCQGALCVAMSFVLSYIKLFSMPAGGSVTLASMLPLMVFANRHGLKWGLFAGLVYGILQFIQKPEIYHWVDVILEYPVAFMLIGLGGLTRGVRNLPFSVLIGGIARFFAHFVAGVIFFGEYVMIGEEAAEGVSFGQMIWPNVVASFLYKAPYMFADIAICFVIALLPPFRKAIKKALKY